MRVQDEGVDADPNQKKEPEQNEKYPTAAECRDTVGQPFTEGPFSLEFTVDIFCKRLVIAQTGENFVFERRQFTLFRFQQRMNGIRRANDSNPAGK